MFYIFSWKEHFILKLTQGLIQSDFHEMDENISLTICSTNQQLTQNMFILKAIYILAKLDISQTEFLIIN